MVGFEPTTSRFQNESADQTALHPDILRAERARTRIDSPEGEQWVRRDVEQVCHWV